MSDETYDCPHVSHCTDCGAVVGSMSPKAVVVCESCALGETPPEKILHCVSCGDQKSIDWDGFLCGPCSRRVKAERQKVIDNAKRSGEFEAICRRLRNVRWSQDYAE